jgi:bifunctional non-homologous end joining protein LigD
MKFSSALLTSWSRAATICASCQRKARLEKLLARRPEGVFANPFERGEIGPALFRAACRMGLEGLVSKLRDRPYQAGRSRYWIKVKNRTHLATGSVS